MSSDTWLILPPIFQLPFLEIIFENACRIMAANEVENLHPVFPWQHLTLSASLVRFSGCSLIDLIVRASSRGQECIWHARHSRARSHAHTWVHTRNTQTQSEAAYGWRAAPHLQMGNKGESFKQCSVYKDLSHWPPTDLVLSHSSASPPLINALIYFPK